MEKYELRRKMRNGSMLARGDITTIRKAFAIAWRARNECTVTDETGYNCGEIWQDIGGDFGTPNRWLWFSLPELAIC